MEATQPVEKPLNERIKTVRKALGLSRAKAAKKWSISAATIRAWEEQKRNPSGLYLARITQILGRLERRRL
ncbi:MAG: helix-turn-helix transcriptional regulator [Terrimicrobiaceae bacterium]